MTLRTVQTRIAQRFKICPASTSGVVYLTNGLFLENEPFFDYLRTQHAPKNSFTLSLGSISIISTFQIGRNQRPLWTDWRLTTKHRTTIDCLNHNPTALTHLLALQWQPCSTDSFDTIRFNRPSLIVLTESMKMGLGVLNHSQSNLFWVPRPLRIAHSHRFAITLDGSQWHLSLFINLPRLLFSKHMAGPPLSAPFQNCGCPAHEFTGNTYKNSAQSISGLLSRVTSCSS